AATPQEDPREVEADPRGRPGSGPGWWLVLSATASIALLAVTNQLTLDVAPIPFLWVVPLTIYLGTFIASFGRSRRYRRGLWGVLLFGSTIGTAAVLAGGSLVALELQVGTLLVFLLSLCMLCHGELAASAPPASRLTAYYLAISVGGALGGFLVAVVAPALFPGLWELPIAAYLGIVLLLASVFRDAPPRLLGTPVRRRATLAASALVFAGVGIGLGWPLFSDHSGTVLSSRNFYGWFVVQSLEAPGGTRGKVLRLLHGGIVHGEQVNAPGLRRYPTAYFGPASGVGLAIRSAVTAGGDETRGIRVGVVGLGVGTLGAWARPQDVYRFYEINPEVIALSTGPRPLFTYLSDPGGKKEVVLGDARLMLEREPDQRYDILVLDAFSSDAIPVHLLTLEAFQLYRRHLAGPRSVLAVHISNRHLDLEPAVRALASATGFRGLSIGEEAKGLARASYWLVLSPSRERLRAPELAPFGEPWIGPARPVRIWTDSYSDVLGTLRALRKP
ncbi:MAG TPA: fused MFS/spermidine synthase, partial [Thermoanaerobaculia bacterium]|nr:fused MFS/spermidine synthase [Thermoanaerobaculia bacterium]